MSDRNYKHFGIDIQQIGLVPFNRSEDSFIDIKPMCVEISIFEDVESSSVSIQVLIEDGIGIIERMPLIGDEKIVISYRTPSFDDYIEAEFDVYKHSVINKSKERVREYAIIGISPETKIDLVSSVDTSYKLSGSETVKAVYNTYFTNKSQIKNTKRLEVSDSLGTQYSIGNGRSPMSFINSIAKDSQSEKYPASNYSFYETLDRKFHFKTLDELMQGEVVQDFYLGDAGKSLGDTQRRAEKDSIFPYQVITDIEVKEGIDGLRKIVGGGYRNSVKVIDPVTKTFSERTFDYLTDDKLTQIAKHKTIPQETSFLKNSTESIHSRLIRSTVIPPSPASIVRQGIADGVGNYLAEAVPSLDTGTGSETPIPSADGFADGLFDSTPENNTSSLQGTTVGGFTVGGGADSFGTGSTSTDSLQGTTVGGLTVGGAADEFGTLLGPGADITFFEERVTADTDPQYFYPKRRHDFAHLDVASRMLLDTITIHCTVSGISDLHVGQVVNIFVPQESNDEEMLRMYNLFYGGDKLKGGKKDAKFLVTKIKHGFNFNQGVYITSFSGVKNSFANKVETESQRVTGGVGDALTSPLEDVVRSVFR